LGLRFRSSRWTQQRVIGGNPFSGFPKEEEEGDEEYDHIQQANDPEFPP
jgi:hypothetical protein